jgi:hypothetical protein
MRLLAFFCLAVSLSVAQSAPADAANSSSPVRVCVAMPSNVSHLSIVPAALRDRLIQEINRDGRKGKVAVEAAAVPGGDIDDSQAAARDQQCRLIVSLRFEESVGFVPQNNDPVSHEPAITRGGPAGTRRATLAYSIGRVDNKGGVDEGGIPLRLGNDDESAASDALSQVSSKAVHDAVKSKP